jgi:hypothetical protein
MDHQLLKETKVDDIYLELISLTKNNLTAW